MQTLSHAEALEDDDARPDDAPAVRGGRGVRGADHGPRRQAAAPAGRPRLVQGRGLRDGRARPAVERRRRSPQRRSLRADETAGSRRAGSRGRLHARRRWRAGDAADVPVGPRPRDREQPRPGGGAARPRGPRGRGEDRRPAPEPRPRLRDDEGHAAPDALARHPVRALEAVPSHRPRPRGAEARGRGRHRRDAGPAAQRAAGLLRPPGGGRGRDPRAVDGGGGDARARGGAGPVRGGGGPAPRRDGGGARAGPGEGRPRAGAVGAARRAGRAERAPEPAAPPAPGGRGRPGGGRAPAAGRTGGRARGGRERRAARRRARGRDRGPPAGAAEGRAIPDARLLRSARCSTPPASSTSATARA